MLNRIPMVTTKKIVIEYHKREWKYFTKKKIEQEDISCIIRNERPKKAIQCVQNKRK